MLSYPADMDAQTVPFEAGLAGLINVDMEAARIGKKVLRAIRDQGTRRNYPDSQLNAIGH